MILIREHFAVPPGLEISLKHFQAWKFSQEGVFFHTLWADPDDRIYMCDHLIRAGDPDFWETTRMSDLIECSYAEYLNHMVEVLS